MVLRLDLAHGDARVIVLAVTVTVVVSVRRSQDWVARGTVTHGGWRTVEHGISKVWRGVRATCDTGGIVYKRVAPNGRGVGVMLCKLWSIGVTHVLLVHCDWIFKGILRLRVLEFRLTADWNRTIRVLDRGHGKL